MTFDLKKIIESKKAFRRALASQSVGEKLRMLDALRERAVLLRKAGSANADIETVAKKGDLGKIKWP